MKQILPLLLFILIGYNTQAQLASGTILPSNIKTVDIKGDSVDVFKWLSEGKTVVIDVFATWCGPCWAFHSSGTLEKFYEEYGPEGTDQLRVIGLEGDGNTPESEIYNSTLGNWSAGVKYNIVNNHTFNNMLQISFFPTLYVIRPNKRVFEIGGYRSNIEIWEKAMFPQKEVDVIEVMGMESRTFCNNAAFNQKPSIINLGSEDINQLTLNFIRNGEVKEIESTQSVPVFKELSLPVPTINQFSETTLFEAVVIKLNNVELAENDQLKFDCTYLRPIVDDLTYQIKFTTDYYPGEITWELKDNNQRSIFKKKYNPGPNQFGGGGADAHKTFTHDITLPDANITCLTLSIADSGGDGLQTFNPATNPIPGVEIIKKDGTVIKPKMSSDYDFTSARTILSRFLLSSDVDDVVLNSFSVFPNPASDIIQIQNGSESAIQYQVFITDMLGRKVSQTLSNATFMEVSTLNPGLYFVNIQTEKGLTTFKFTKS